MEALAHKSEISNTFSSVRTFSFNEKKSPLLDGEPTNVLLDAILDLKKSLKEKTEKIHDVNERIEKLTWFDDLDEESLMLLNDLISSAKDLYSSLIRQYVILNNVLRKKGIAKEEIKDFKNSIDELRETYEDLESVFFFLPKMPEFVQTTRQLSLV
jgi:acyl carrier protein phosphodiesterase